MEKTRYNEAKWFIDEIGSKMVIGEIGIIDKKCINLNVYIVTHYNNICNICNIITL